MVSKVKQQLYEYWEQQAKDENLGETIREWYKDKLRKAGVKGYERKQ